MDADGSNAAPLTPAGDLSQQDPAYSHDGRKLVFQQFNTAGNSGVRLAAADLSGAIDLTTAPAGDATTWDLGPVFSPDGKTIAYSHASIATITATLWSISANGGEPTQLTHELQGLKFDMEPVFSPDGATIAFTYGGFGLNEIDMIDADGSKRVPFTPPAAVIQAPDSPTGSIVTLSSSSPDFSPDGSKMVFSQCCDANQHSRIVVAPITDGSAVTVLTSPDADHTDGTPAFSPDGTQIVFVRTAPPSGKSVISSVPAEGGAVTTLTTPGATDSSPTWQPAPQPDATPPETKQPTLVVPPPPGTNDQSPATKVVHAAVLAKRAVSTKKGTVHLSLHCPVVAQVECTGTLTLEARLKPHHGPTAIGKTRFAIQPGRSMGLRIRLSVAARRMLGHGRSLKTIARLEPAGGTSSVTALKLSGAK